MFKNLKNCNNTEDFRKLAKMRLALVLFFTILMELQMMKLLLKEIQKHMKIVIWFLMF